MDGWPVWLASVSLRNRLGRIIPTGNYSDAQRAMVEDHTAALVEGVGDAGRERLFRMCITTCRHRALTPAERDALPDWWHDAPAVDIAGGPVEVLWMQGVEDMPATRPCESPGREPIDIGLWLPVDCGECVPCLARSTCRSLPGRRP